MIGLIFCLLSAHSSQVVAQESKEDEKAEQKDKNESKTVDENVRIESDMLSYDASAKIAKQIAEECDGYKRIFLGSMVVKLL